MSTISNSQDEVIVVLILALLLMAFTSCCPAFCTQGSTGIEVSNTPPESPRAAPEPDSADKPLQTYEPLRPVVMKSVRVSRPNASLIALAGEGFRQTATDPLVIEVQLEEEISMAARTSWPVILLNGEKLATSRVHPGHTDRLVAFLPDRRRIKDTNTVTVEWVGNEAQTRPKTPLVFRRDAIE